MFNKEFLLKYNISRIDCNLRCGYPSIVTIHYNDRRRKKIKLTILETLNLENIICDAILNNDRQRKIKKLKRKIR